MSEQATFIQPSEIIGIEFKCPSCEASILYPLEKKQPAIPNRCPVCGEPWLVENEAVHPSMPRMPQQVAQVVSQLKGLAQSNDVKVKVRLQLKPEPKRT